MSEQNMEVLTDKEAMEAIGAFANICYDRGVRDTLIGVGIGAGISVLVVFGVEAIQYMKDRKERRRQLKEFMSKES